MRIIGRRKLLEAAADDRTLEKPLSAWFKVASTSNWKNIVEVRQTYPTADYVDPHTVFNIRGNRYRLIARIDYGMQLTLVKHVLTHAEYDRGRWKE